MAGGVLPAKLVGAPFVSHLLVSKTVAVVTNITSTLLVFGESNVVKYNHLLNQKVGPLRTVCCCSHWVSTGCNHLECNHVETFPFMDAGRKRLLFVFGCQDCSSRVYHETNAIPFQASIVVPYPEYPVGRLRPSTTLWLEQALS